MRWWPTKLATLRRLKTKERTAPRASQPSSLCGAPGAAAAPRAGTLTLTAERRQSSWLRLRHLLRVATTIVATTIVVVLVVQEDAPRGRPLPGGLVRGPPATSSSGQPQRDCQSRQPKAVLETLSAASPRPWCPHKVMGMLTSCGPREPFTLAGWCATPTRVESCVLPWPGRRPRVRVGSQPAARLYSKD